MVTCPFGRAVRALGLLLILCLALPAGARAEDNATTALRWYIYGNALYKQGDYKDAQVAYRKATALDPANKDAWTGLGNTYTQMKQGAKASDAYRASEKLEPASAPQSLPAPQAAAQAGAEGGHHWVAAAAWSVVIPGSGQVYEGHTTKGVCFGVVTLGLLGGALATGAMASNDGSAYMALGGNLPQSTYDNSYTKWSNDVALNHGLVIGFGIAYAYTLIDAIVCAKAHPVAAAGSRVAFACIPGGMRADVEVLRF